MNTRWLKSIFSLAMAAGLSISYAQTINETVQPLSKKAHKGYLDDVNFENDNINVLYKIPGDKNADEKFFEQYAFDKNLKFIDSKPVNEPKAKGVEKPDRERKFMRIWVGGKTSFDVLSMKLKVNLRTEKQKWNFERQRYVREKVVSDETIKLKTEEGKSYYGVAKFWDEEEDKGVVLCYFETKDKSNPKQYVLLSISYDGEVAEHPLEVKGSYSMVYCQEISEDKPGTPVGKDDFIVILAPNNGMPDLKKYVYLHYDIKGNLKNKMEFNSPSTNMIITSAKVKDGDLFLTGLSKDGSKAYEDVFEDYASMVSPGYSGYLCFQAEKYQRKADDEMDNFHLMRISGDKMLFASTAPISEFKKKAKFAPGDKGGKVYKGKKFYVNNLMITPTNEFLITGQQLSTVNIGDLKNPQFEIAYGDIVCLHFDATGTLKAEYAVDKVFEDKKSEIFPMPQRFFVSGDGKYAYWEIMEVKGFSGYENFWDAMAQRKTFFPRYFPRITKIDLQSATLSEFKIPGQKKYFTYKNNGRFFDANSLTVTYIGRDDDHENLWTCKVKLD